MIAKSCLLAILLMTCLAAVVRADDPEREEYLRQRAAEKATAEAIVAELTREDRRNTPDDWLRLTRAYNELGDHAKCLEAIWHVPESYLAEHGELELKAVVYHNVNFGYANNPFFVGFLEQYNRNQLWGQELLFFDRCIDRGYVNKGVWLYRKAKLLCRSSVETYYFGSGRPMHDVRDRERYEHAFALLERAFEVEPNLLEIHAIQRDVEFGNKFTLLETEPRFQRLFETALDRLPADALDALPE